MDNSVQADINQDVTNYSTTKEITDKIKELSYDTEARAIAKRFGLDISTVTWEGAKKIFNPSTGSNISDMTIGILDEPMPVIKQFNFKNKTWEYNMHKIPILVNNEIGLPVKIVPLDQYLKNIYKYTYLPEGTSLYVPTKDLKVLVSAQTCFLPIIKETGNNNSKQALCEFHIQMFNYQSEGMEPNVLNILATGCGTSPQLPTNLGQRHQNLYFNNNGAKESIKYQYNIETQPGLNNSNDNLSIQNNNDDLDCLFVIQIPLKHKIKSSFNSFTQSDFIYSNNHRTIRNPISSVHRLSPGPNSLSIETLIDRFFRNPKIPLNAKETLTSDFKIENKFPILFSTIERDENQPVKVMIQFFKPTFDGLVDEQTFEQIDRVMKDAKIKGTCWNSLSLGNPV